MSDVWGFDRGLPIDRYYIETFLDRHRADIRGNVLEVGNSDYTRRFGSAVVGADVLDIDAANPRATIVADLAAADEVPADSFDCFILTQTLHLVYDTRGALRHARRLLRPGGRLLLTAPCVSRISRRAQSHDYWRFTSASLSRLLDETFGPGCATVESFGSILTATGFLTGIAAQELTRSGLDAHDPFFPVVLAARVVKP